MSRMLDSGVAARPESNPNHDDVAPGPAGEAAATTTTFDSPPMVPDHMLRSRRIAILGAPSVFYAGLAVTLGGAPSIEVVGRCDQPEMDAPLCKNVDITVLDLEVWGVETVDRLSSNDSEPAADNRGVIAVSSPEEVELSARALLAGARCVLSKDASPAEFVTAVHAVGYGSLVLASHVATWLMKGLQHHTSEADNTSAYSSIDGLCSTAPVTPRQREVLALLVAGLSNAEIAARLDVSKPTVKSHVSALLRIFDVRDRMQLVLLANQRRANGRPPLNAAEEVRLGASCSDPRDG